MVTPSVALQPVSWTSDATTGASTSWHGDVEFRGHLVAGSSVVAHRQRVEAGVQGIPAMSPARTVRGRRPGVPTTSTRPPLAVPASETASLVVCWPGPNWHRQRAGRGPVRRGEGAVHGQDQRRGEEADIARGVGRLGDQAVAPLRGVRLKETGRRPAARRLRAVDEQDDVGAGRGGRRQTVTVAALVMPSPTRLVSLPAPNCSAAALRAGVCRGGRSTPWARDVTGRVGRRDATLTSPSASGRPRTTSRTEARQGKGASRSEPGADEGGAVTLTWKAMTRLASLTMPLRSGRW